MNIIFLTISRITDINARGIYTDLMRKFRDEGHQIYIVTPYERQFGRITALTEQDGIKILGVKVFNIRKANVIEKGIGTILLGLQFDWAIKKYLKDIYLDLILYSTPPITFTQVIKSLKIKNPKAVSYLLLKDIFPQNAVDLAMFSKKSIFYQYFRKKEIAMYKVSDYIGCMSPANVEYILQHNSFLKEQQVGLAPNSIELQKDMEQINKREIRKKYDLPIDTPIFIYGGNLGKPQGIDFLISCLNANKNRKDCFFLIVGDGTEYNKLSNWIKEKNPSNIRLIARLPKVEYDLLVQSCDVGLIFLDSRFTIPNYPSRLLSYLEYKMPILAATDIHTDIGKIAEMNNYGFWCPSTDVVAFTKCVDKYVHNIFLIQEMGENAYSYLKENYLVENTYSNIINRL